MSEAQQLSDLISDVYDAALDPALWPATLGRLTHFVGGSASSLFSKNPVTRGGIVFHHDGGIPASWIDKYAAEYVRFDPTTVRQFFAAAGETLSTVDVMPYAEFVDSRFHAEWVKPVGLVDSLTAVLDKQGADIAMFTVFRAEADGMHDAAMRRRMHLLVPHLRRAGAVVQSLRQQALLAEALDGLVAGVFLLDTHGRPLHVNIAGQDLLHVDGGALRLSSDRLTATDPVADKALATALATACSAGTEAPRSSSLALRDSLGGVYLATLWPITVPQRDGLPRGTIAVLFVQSVSGVRRTPAEVLAKTYGLTPSELRVLLAVDALGGGPMLAESLGIAETTARFHLRNLFAKTGTHRQAELVKLVAAFSSPPFPV